MKNISEKEVIAFGHVLEAIGKVIASKPELIMNFLDASINDTLNQHKDSNHEEVDREKVEKYPLYDLAKSIEESELVERLLEFNLLELRYLIKIFRLGSNKYKSKERIAAYIAEQAKKRSIDVFREHNLDSSGDEKIDLNTEGEIDN